MEIWAYVLLAPEKRRGISAVDKALELDPDYGSARQNKRAVFALGDGKRLQEQGRPFQSVEYYKEKVLSEREDKQIE